jgi:hypothetical protein
VSLAARGSRQTGEAVERIEDGAELMQVRSQARRVHVKSALAAVAMTLVAVLLPTSL